MQWIAVALVSMWFVISLVVNLANRPTPSEVSEEAESQ